MIRSPNIWDHPEIYELENLASDRAGVIDAHLASLRPLAGAALLDIGCGSGFHLTGFAAAGARVVGLEPHLPLAAAAHHRVCRAPAPGAISPPPFPAAVLAASAEAIPLPDNSIDIIHARWAYFFGAGSEPGLAEAERVLRPGGLLCVVDNDATRSTFGGWFRRAYPAYDPTGVERFWTRQGFRTDRLTIAWTFDRREDFEAVVRIEFPPGPAEEFMAEHPGTEVDYAVAIRWKRF